MNNSAQPLQQPVHKESGHHAHEAQVASASAAAAEQAALKKSSPPPTTGHGPRSAPALGIRRMEALHYYVSDLERSKRFYGELLGLPMVARSEASTRAAGHQQTLVYRAGDLDIVVSQPEGDGGRAQHFLRQHPDGIGTLVFEVGDIERCFRLLDQRGGTPIHDIKEARDGDGSLRYFSITTPLGDTTFRFVQREGYGGIFPGLETLQGAVGDNPYGLGAVDHITANFQTMSPSLLWFQHVMGFVHYWDVEFHTSDVAQDAQFGSGLRSVVMADLDSGVKFPHNEPLRPFFKDSQINLFNTQHRGNGVQHIALTVPDVLTAVRGLRARGVEFLHTPDAYYDRLPDFLRRRGVGAIEEDIDTLREHQVLVDGSSQGNYILQIFMKDAQGLYDDPQAGPFFFELIQRKGDRGFGEGNFRALFESIERDQVVPPEAQD